MAMAAAGPAEPIRHEDDDMTTPKNPRDSGDSRGSDNRGDTRIDARIEELVRREILDIDAYHAPPADGLIKLDAMENPYPLPAELRREWLARAGEVEINRYPDPQCAALKRQLRATFGIDDSVAITLGNGSDELLLMLMLLVGGRGRTVLAPTPTFSMYQLIAALTGGEFTGVPLRADFTLDGDALLDAIRRRRPALVFLAYPNNPTGNCFDEAVMIEALAQAPGLVVVDEAYFAFCRRSFAARLQEFPHLMVLRTLSKSGMAALRLGFLLAHPKWATQLEKTRLPYNIGALTQRSAAFLLEHDAVMRAQADRIIHSREALRAALSALPVRAFPSAANFILFRTATDAARIHAALKSRGVLIKNLHAPATPLENCLRVTIGNEQENTQFLDALRDSLNE